MASLMALFLGDPDQLALPTAVVGLSAGDLLVQAKQDALGHRPRTA
jgi:hypothetical protein